MGAEAVVVAVVPQVVGERSIMMKSKLKQITKVAALEGFLLRRRYFGEQLLAQVAERIRQGESSHSGELVVAIEAIMPNHEPVSHLRALEVYGRLRVWDTPLNSGVLLYLALDQQAIEIIADRGITVTNAQWQQVCVDLQARFSKADYTSGLIEAIDTIQALLKEHAPQGDNDANVLPNQPVFI